MMVIVKIENLQQEIHCRKNEVSEQKFGIVGC
jgi:hypothetical protein